MPARRTITEADECCFGEDGRNLARACKMLREKLQELVKLDEELQMERKDTPTHVAVQDKLALIRRMVAFLDNGGQLPGFFEVKCATFSSGAFVTQLPTLVGGFLITKSTAMTGSEPKPRRAVYAIEGLFRGQVALRKLQGSGPVDPDVKKLANADPDAPGGWTADSTNVQKCLHVICPRTLTAWASHVLTHEVAACEEAMQKAVVEEHTRNEREKEASLRLELYNARAPWRAEMKRMRGQLLRELWATLWSANFPRVQSIAMAMKRVGVNMTEKVFHEVTVSGYGADRYFTVLEDAGATSEELQFEWQEIINSQKVSFVRRHAQATAIDVYDCMRGDNAAPAGVLRMRSWLLEECGPPSRTQWGSQFLTRSPGRNMMVSKSFVPKVLVDLMKEGLAVSIPKVPETVDDLQAWHNERDALEAAEADQDSNESARQSLTAIPAARRSIANPRGTTERFTRKSRAVTVEQFLTEA